MLYTYQLVRRDLQQQNGNSSESRRNRTAGLHPLQAAGGGVHQHCALPRRRRQRHWRPARRRLRQHLHTFSESGHICAVEHIVGNKAAERRIE